MVIKNTTKNITEYTMKKKTFSLMLMLISLFALSAQSANNDYKVSSPDGKLTMTISVGDKVTYTVTAGEQLLVAPSAIALVLEDGTTLGERPRVSSSRKGSKSEVINAPFYRQSSFESSYNSLTLKMKGNWGIEARAFNDGVAYRLFTTLKKNITNMEDKARQADTVARENQRLRALLDFKQTHEDYKMVDAYIIGWSSNDWSSTYTINRGSNSGIEINMCAITANGEVVGLVTEVGLNYAVVKTVLDSTLEISGTISSSGYNGMVSGGYIGGQETLLKMNYLPSDSIIRNQDQVVTSGSTVYPRGLIMGYVVDAGFEETGVAKFALLDPAAEISSLEQIFIITQYTTEDAVSPAAAEGAAAAGDAVVDNDVLATTPDGNVG